MSVQIPDTNAIFDALPSAVLVLDADRSILTLNPAAEQLFSASEAQLLGRSFDELLAPHSALSALVRQVAEERVSVSEYGIALALAKGRGADVDAHILSMAEDGPILLLLHRCSVAQRLDRHLAHRGSARSIAALAQTLAHEVKNPLSGIRGAAQLLEGGLGEEDKALVQLIVDETDRVVALIDGMDPFAEQRPLERQPLNIHQVLEHVRRVAENGFARNLRVVENYDPSLPDVAGDRDQLIQVFLNLVKNAAEAAPRDNGRITIVTHYQHGLKVQVGSSSERIELPITVEVRDNGEGVAADMIDHLFEPFISSKPRGRGLGLSLVAKIVNDHGGIVAYAGEESGPVFRVRLPAHKPARAPAAGIPGGSGSDR
ncbi:MAG: ATP-binding protein [Geminicoccaceae bacterium]